VERILLEHRRTRGSVGPHQGALPIIEKPDPEGENLPDPKGENLTQEEGKNKKGRTDAQKGIRRPESSYVMNTRTGSREQAQIAYGKVKNVGVRKAAEKRRAKLLEALDRAGDRIAEERVSTAREILKATNVGDFARIPGGTHFTGALLAAMSGEKPKNTLRGAPITSEGTAFTKEALAQFLTDVRTLMETEGAEQPETNNISEIGTRRRMVELKPLPEVKRLPVKSFHISVEEGVQKVIPSAVGHGRPMSGASWRGDEMSCKLDFRKQDGPWPEPEFQRTKQTRKGPPNTMRSKFEKWTYVNCEFTDYRKAEEDEQEAVSGIAVSADCADGIHRVWVPTALTSASELKERAPFGWMVCFSFLKGNEDEPELEPVTDESLGRGRVVRRLVRRPAKGGRDEQGFVEHDEGYVASKPEEDWAEIDDDDEVLWPMKGRVQNPVSLSGTESESLSTSSSSS